MIMGIAVFALFTTAIMLLWNALIPSIFGLATINFWQALGLFVLSRILFGGFGPFGHGKMMMGRKMMGHHNNPLHEKWHKMTPEQREIFELTEMDGIPVKEISETTGLPVNTLLSRKHYAVKYLRKRLETLYKDILYS